MASNQIPKSFDQMMMMMMMMKNILFEKFTLKIVTTSPGLPYYTTLYYYAAEITFEAFVILTHFLA